MNSERKNTYDPDEDDLKAFTDFSGIYKFLRIVLAVILTGGIWYWFNL